MMGAEPRLRDAREDELDEVRALTRVAYAEFAEVMEPAAWVGLAGAVHEALRERRPGVHWIVAELEGRLVGSVMLYPPAVRAYGGLTDEPLAAPELRLLSVRPEARGTGIGEALVRECVRRAREMGAAELGLHTSRSMEAAIRMYERLGFERAPERDFQPPGAELVTGYRLPIPPG
jgi:ribosomal protein S18 acetylase RimI-like enzyme